MTETDDTPKKVAAPSKEPYEDVPRVVPIEVAYKELATHENASPEEADDWRLRKLFIESVNNEKIRRRIEGLMATVAVAGPLIYNAAAITSEQVAQGYNIDTAIPQTIVAIGGMFAAAHLAATREGFVEKLALSHRTEQRLNEFREQYKDYERYDPTESSSTIKLELEDDGDLPENAIDLIPEEQVMSLDELVGSQ